MEEEIKKTISEVHFQHKLWINELNFYKEDLLILKERLENSSMDQNNNRREVLLNFVDLKFKTIEVLIHSIHENEKAAVASGKLHIRRIDYLATADHLFILDKMVMFAKEFKKLKKDILQYLKKMV